MKENDLKIEINEHPLAMFAEKDDGTYGSVQTGSYMVENYFDDFWEKQKNFKKSALNKLLKNEVSPIYLYMEINNMTESDLASRVGISTGKVKKHNTVTGFNSINISLLKKYAEIFDISLSNFFRVDLFASTEKSKKNIETTADGIIIIEREENE